MVEPLSPLFKAPQQTFPPFLDCTTFNGLSPLKFSIVKVILFFAVALSVPFSFRGRSFLNGVAVYFARRTPQCIPSVYRTLIDECLLFWDFLFVDDFAGFLCNLPATLISFEVFSQRAMREQEKETSPAALQTSAEIVRPTFEGPGRVRYISLFYIHISDACS